MHAIQPLQEYTALFPIHSKSVPIGKFVTEWNPFSLDENLKTFHSAVVRIEEELCQGDDLRGSVPAVAAVHHDGLAPVVNGSDHLQGTGEQLREILEPLGALQSREETEKEGERERERSEREREREEREQEICVSSLTVIKTARLGSKVKYTCTCKVRCQ